MPRIFSWQLLFSPGRVKKEAANMDALRNQQIFTLCRFIFRPTGRKMNLQKKESTMLPQANLL
jgi:hypothetical protein